ncbi:MAG: hypothetical protein K6G81_10825 [Lachnospiraceae bacterium]|nr:hypothetical protein [Lachnospiraceae bacterium]
MTGYSSKLKRQVLLLVIFGHVNSIIDLEVINKSVPMNIRTLQRDINELSEAGFLDVSFDRVGKCYQGEVYIPETFSGIPDEKRKYYQNMARFVRIIFDMECLTYSEIDEALFQLHYYKDMYEFWIEDDKYGPEPKCEDLKIDESLSADKAYYRMFPQLGKKDFEKDCEFLRDIGYPIEYDEELDVYYKNFPEELPA